MHEYIRETSSWKYDICNVVIIGLPLHVLDASTAGVVIGKMNA